MAATVTKVLLGKVFAKEENEFRMFYFGGERDFFFGAHISAVMLLPLNQI